MRRTEGASGGGGLDEVVDKRVTWLEQKATAALRLKQADAKRLFDNDDHRALLLEFLDQADRRSVFIVGNANGYAVMSSEKDAVGHKPLEYKRKVFFFLKLRKERIVDDKALASGGCVTFGDLTPDVLQALQFIVKGVVMPLVSSAAVLNAANVPPVSRRTLVDYTHDFYSETIKTVGRHHHLTMLPRPNLALPRSIHASDIENGTIDRPLIHGLEKTLVNWAELIRDAVDASPESLPQLLQRHPGPMDEVSFWEQKTVNLKQLEAQLCTPYAGKMLVILKLCGSTYYEPFNALIFEVHEALAESTDVHRFLKPLVEVFELMNVASANHQSVKSLAESNTFRRLFCLLYAVWCHCPKFSTVGRMVHLISLCVNDIIDVARESITVQDVFASDTEEIYKTLTTTLVHLGEFKNAFFFYKAVSVKEHQRPWRFQNTALFKRLDMFLERIHDLLDLVETATLFGRLANLRVGGVAGVEQCAEIDQLQAHFMLHFNELQAATYDMLDIDDPRFERDYNKFQQRVTEAERHLAAVLSRSLNDNLVSLPNSFKVVDSFDGFTDRVVAQHEWSAHQPHVLAVWRHDLLTVQEEFVSQKDHPPELPNTPPTSGALVWANSLLQRVQVAHPRMLELGKHVLKTDSAEETFRLFEALRNNLRSFMQSTYEAWASNVGGLSMERLRSFLLLRAPPPPAAGTSTALATTSSRGASPNAGDSFRASTSGGLLAPSGSVVLQTLTMNTPPNFKVCQSALSFFQHATPELGAAYLNAQRLFVASTGGAFGDSSASVKLIYAVNFDPLVVRTLKEVNYVELLAQEHEDQFTIPPQVVAITKQRETLRNFVLQLQHVCDSVNTMEATLLPCEKALIEHEWTQLEGTLSRGLSELQWSRPDAVEAYIQSTIAEVEALHVVVTAMQSNLVKIWESFAEFISDDKFLPLGAGAKGTDAFRVMTEGDFRKKLREHCASREAKMKAIVNRVHQLMDDTFQVVNSLKAQLTLPQLNSEATIWQQYITFASKHVERALAQSTASSLKHVRDQLDERWLASNNGVPLLDVKLILWTPPSTEGKRQPAASQPAPAAAALSPMSPRKPGQKAIDQPVASRFELQETHITFDPVVPSKHYQFDVAVHAGNASPPPAPTPLLTLEFMLDELVSSILNLLRLAEPPGSRAGTSSQCSISADVHYDAQLLHDPVVQGLLRDLSGQVDETTHRARDVMAQYLKYQFLYEAPPQARFRRFLTARSSSVKEVVVPDDEEAGEDGGAPAVVAVAAVSDGAVTPVDYFGVPMADLEREITKCEELEDELESLVPTCTVGFLKLDSKPLKHSLLDLCVRYRDALIRFLTGRVMADLNDLYAFMSSAEKGLGRDVLDGDIASLKAVLRCIRDCRQRHVRVSNMIEPMAHVSIMLKQHAPRSVSLEMVEKIEELRKPALEAWTIVYRRSLNVREQNSSAQDREAERMKDEATLFEESLAEVGAELHNHQLYSYALAPDSSYDQIDAWALRFNLLDKSARDIWELQELFELTATDFRDLRDCRAELVTLKQVWDLVNHVNHLFRNWMSSSFFTADVDSFLDEIKKFQQQQLRTLPMKARDWPVFKGLEREAANMAKALPLCAELRSPAMRPRHWQSLLATTKRSLPGRRASKQPAREVSTPRDSGEAVSTATLQRTGSVTAAPLDPSSDPSFTLESLINLGLHDHAEEVYNVVEKAQRELTIERSLTKIIDTWDKLLLTYEMNAKYDIPLLAPVDAIIEQLEADNNTLQGMLANRFVEYFLDSVQLWQRNLGVVDTCLNKWLEIQRKWVNLYPIFVLSADIREQLPEDARNFAVVDEMFRNLMRVAFHYRGIIEVLCTSVLLDGLQKTGELESYLQQMEDILISCEKSLTEYLETKRKIFPRFFFVSSADLVDILSKGSDPRAVMIHMSKIVDSVEYFALDNNPLLGNSSPLTPASASPGHESSLANVAAPAPPSVHPKQVWEMVSIQGEHVRLAKDYICDGPVESWLAGCIDVMQVTMKQHISEANVGYTDKARTEWIYMYPCQAVIVASRTWFTTECESAFRQLEEGTETAMKDFLKAQKQQLDTLIREVLLDRDSNQRKMLVHLITIDVHSRDIIQQLVDEKTDAVDAFSWQSQLRYRFDEARGSTVAICDADFVNGYEYIGLCGCLVITKLTDRCYITLSQALNLKRGGAPAGPAGTGKTETTKDLARNLGIACYVFNCSDQMNYITLGQIFKGLAMSGSWGCFDEFNRISIEVLSVVATQVGRILNALKANKKRFNFMDEDIGIIHSVGIFITMNPGYAGRTELPENIKSLFRPCAMCVPDLKNICEIMLAAEGFGDAKDLALKFVTLYKLNKELLSPQDHYDWGLRAVKSVLYIAGALKRSDPDVPERKVLMRALRDTNLAKLSKDDVYVFMGLIRALFPNVEVKKRDKPELSDALKAACKELGNFPGDQEIFILKGLQYEEILHVRHSVFILGPAGCGKTQVWKCLQLGLHKLGDKCATQVINPKAITSNELYGYIHPQSKEWRDGILSNIFRQFAIDSRNGKKNSKWIVLDGIIDAEWIESMNTVMDDNKMLTLVSNERIPLTESMRMIFEVSHLRNASPATVSRGGVVFINESDLGWGPFKDKWLATRADERESTHIEGCFDKYMGPTFEFWKRTCKTIVPCMDINIVQTICYLLEGLLEHIGKDKPAEVYEKYFVFALVWGFGGPLSSDGRVDFRTLFSNWWRKENPAVKMGEVGTVFDYYIDASDRYELKPWSTLVEPFQYDPDVPVASMTVPTAETTRMTRLMNLLVDNAKPVLLVGTAGTGKSSLMLTKLRGLDNAHTIFRVIAFNARTSSNALQTVMEQSLEKRTGRQFGPPNRKKLVFFMDDLNMPNPDKYGTQDAIALMQQHINYGCWYDRIKIQLKEIVDVRYVAAMNPKSGTFHVLDRLQRHFAVFATSMPERADLYRIYGQIFGAHLAKFPAEVKQLADTITYATIDLHTQITKVFLPTAVLFHYQWNMRELGNIFQGLTKSLPQIHNQPATFARMWYNECVRTFRDRMPRDTDLVKFDEIILAQQRASFPELPPAEWEVTKDTIWAPFTTTKEGLEGVYDEIQTSEAFSYLGKKLVDYNSQYARMDLVLFQDAVEHVCRVCRITSNPRGNALLVGVGGSGKQSLARLASYINQLEIFQIQVTGTYGLPEFRVDMQELYKKCGLKNAVYSFILTDLQMVSEDMLVYVNDMLNSGNVPELFIGDERDGIVSAITNEVKASGNPDYGVADVCFEYFIEKVRSNLHIVLCFSPLSRTFATWCRQFPALSNTTVIDWFQPWPRTALQSVAKRFLNDIGLGSVERVTNVAEFMAECHIGVTETCEEYYRSTKRRAYTTPKSFLELINLYKELLARKRGENDDKNNRLVVGCDKIREASVQVAQLQTVLQRESLEVEEARQKTARLLETVGREKAIVSDQSAIAEVEEAKTVKIAQEAEAIQSDCQRDLAAARPLVEEALAALKTLDKNSLTELKSMSRPPEDVVMVCAAVKVLTSDPRRIPTLKQRDWAACKQMMANVTQWMKDLEGFDQDNIPQPAVDAVQLYVTNPSFDPASVVTKSFAASGLCKWVIAMNKYHSVRLQVRPKEERLAEANERLEKSRAALRKIQDKVSDLKLKLDGLMRQYDDAVNTSNLIEAKAKKTKDKMGLAERLVGGLSDEKIRWAKTIEELKRQREMLIGDVLLASAFVSYVGPFSRDLRDKIVKEKWTVDILRREVPMTPNLDVILGILTNEANIAGWNNEGLPNDAVSVQNGSIMTNCSRWPLMIDPQLQGAKWIRTREESNHLVVVQPGSFKWIHKITQCVEEGWPCMIETIGESLDPVLGNVLGRVTFRRGPKTMIRIGGNEVEYHKKFRLFLQTRMSNPHYKPEINAQTTLINFMVTELGLEDQLLAVVVNQERPDLEERRVTLIRHMNTMTIELQQCEDGLLFELSNATGDILENVALVENLENTKRKAIEINKSMTLAIDTQTSIATSRQSYRLVATRGALLFFQLDLLCRIDHMYQYSLEAYMVVFNKALDKAAKPADPRNVAERVRHVVGSVTENVYAYVARGLFERHKLIFSSMLCFAILSRQNEIERRQLDFLLRGTRKVIEPKDRPESVREWCPEANWAAVMALADVDGTTPPMQTLPGEIAENNRWRLWSEAEKPEDEKMPGEWKSLNPFQRLLILRCLRPDRLTAALEKFVAQSIGRFFVTDQAIDIGASFLDAGVTTPLFFILSPGVDPVSNVEALGKRLGYTEDAKKLFIVSLGQGQEVVAERDLGYCFEHGGWVMLNNVHLVEKWLRKLEKMIEGYSDVYTKMARIARRKAEKRAAKRLAWINARNAERGEKEASGEGAAATDGHGASPDRQGDEGGHGHVDGAASPSDNGADNGGAPAADASPPASPDTDLGEQGDGDAGVAAGAAAEQDDPDMPQFADSSDDEEDAASGGEEGSSKQKGSMHFRIFLSAEPSDKIPIGILQRSIKLTSEPPTGIAQNLKRALSNFQDEPWERVSKPVEFRAVLFAMCFFHAVVVERKKFGPQGWNRGYPFNVGDLTTCVDVLAKYIDDRARIPWEDLRYVFGEIMYGGHITDDWDRVLCSAYLQQWVIPEVADGMDLCPGFSVPPPCTYQEYLSYVDQACPPESPILYGLHPNAEINFRTTQADVLFRTINELQPKQAAGGAVETPQDVVRGKLDFLIAGFPDPINLQDISDRLDEDRTPPQHVFYQEAERANLLILSCRRALTELDLGLQGALSMTPAMQNLFDDIFMDKVPEVFAKVSFASLRALSSWFDNFLQRFQQVQDWTGELATPKVTMLSYFFNPMSFLTAIMQHTSMLNSYDLDQMALICEVTKKVPEQIDVAARDAAHVYGVFLEGARWDVGQTCIDDAKVKELYPRMPVMTIKAIPLAKADRRDQYECPMYKTQARGPGFVVSLFLKSKQPARKWIVAGVGMLLDVVE